MVKIRLMGIKCNRLTKNGVRLCGMRLNKVRENGIYTKKLDWNKNVEWNTCISFIQKYHMWVQTCV